MSKVVVIGLDGATWDLLMPLAHEGFLPNLQRLVQEGCWGELQSTLPPVTAPAWATFATGMNPGKTGVFDFLVPRDSLAVLRPVTSRDIGGSTFYEIINDFGLTTVLINLPLSYPPRTRQTTITCMMTQGSQFIFPPGLTRKIPELAHYRIIPNMDLRAQGRLEEYAQDIRELEHTRFTCAQRLFVTQWDFFFLLFSGTDFVQHELYDKLLSNALPREHSAFQLFGDIDRYIGWFAEHLPGDTHLLIMSDHGFRPYRGVFLVHQWLKGQRLLQWHYVKDPVKVHMNIITKEMVEAGAREAATRKFIPTLVASCKRPPGEVLPNLRSAVFRPVLQALNPLHLGRRLDVDYHRTLAACTSPALSGIYVNSAVRFQDGIVPDEELGNIKEQLIRGLRDLRDPLTGTEAFACILDNSEAYSGDRAYLGPDIVISPDNWLVLPTIMPASRATPFRPKPVNHHSTAGMLLCYGPRIKRNHSLQQASIQDMAPTILHLLGLPCPGDVDGRTLVDMFDGEVSPRPHRQRSVPEKQRIGRVTHKLRESGAI